MASCAAGAFAGPAKQAMLGLIRLQTNLRVVDDKPYSPVSATIIAFKRIISHSATVNSRGKSVVGMSFAAPVALLWWPNGRDGGPNRHDVFAPMLLDLYKVGIAVVTSAGNYAENNPPVNDLNFHTPRRNGGTNTPLIVVGNNDVNNQRYYKSQYVDSDNKGYLSIYAVGVDCVCGNWDSSQANTAATQDQFRFLSDVALDENGSSQATAQTVGVIAAMLNDPVKRATLASGGMSNFAMAVKTELIRMATANKGTFPDGIPRLSNDITIPCSGDSVSGPPIPPAPNVPAELNQNGLTPVLQEVYNGQAVTFQNPVSSPLSLSSMYHDFVTLQAFTVQTYS